MGLPCPSDADPADFYEEFLSDPVRIWEAEKVNQRKAAESLRDPWSTPLRKTVPPLTTEEMQLYFKASLQSENWAIMTRSSPSVSLSTGMAEACFGKSS